MTVLGNFDVVEGDIYPNFQETGTWYEYFSREELEVTDTNEPIRLEPGEYRMYSTEPFPDHGIPLSSDDTPDAGDTQAINVYPNPARHHINVESAAVISEVQIIDLVGRTVARQQPNQRQATIDVDRLHTGVYFVRVTTADGKVVTERMQVTR